jgi:hypothetical protein
VGEDRDTVTERVSIRPNVGMLSLFPHMRYQPWYALGELVDNAIQSYIANRDRLRDVDVDVDMHPFGTYQLKISIEISKHDGGSIVVTDNAAGISAVDFQRAFRVAEPPADASGLSQFGIGMKAAAAWFAKEFSVRSSALGETVVRDVTFNIPEIVATKNEELAVHDEPTEWSSHFTVVRLWNLNRIPRSSTLTKIRTYLGGIYREFLRNGDVVIELDGEPITFNDPLVLLAPKYAEPDSEPALWRKDVDVHLESGRRVQGWVAIRESGQASQAGLALLYRNKVVQGGGGDAYKPEEIFGKSNSFRSQRVFGELRMDDFAVTYTKDALVWFDEEEEFVEHLRDQLNTEPLALLRQAEGYRVRQPVLPPAEVLGDVLERTVNLIGTSLKIDTATPLPQTDLEVSGEEFEHSRVADRQVTVTVDNRPWHVALALVSDEARTQWLTVKRRDDNTESHLDIVVNQAHPFMRNFAEVPSQELEPVWRLAVALGLAQELARNSGDKAGFVLLRVNQLLRDHLATQV